VITGAGGVSALAGLVATDAATNAKTQPTMAMNAAGARGNFWEPDAMNRTVPASLIHRQGSTRAVLPISLWPISLQL
jgi:hypothetical protein